VAISFNFGSGTQGAGVTKTLAPWAYATAFRITADNGSAAQMTDIVAPLDKKTTAKVTLTKIANVYQTLANNEIPVANQSGNTSGGTIFAELKTIATKTVGAQEVMIPLVGRIELRIPNDADIAESDIEKLVMATYGLLCDATGSPVVVAEKLRGALTPAGI